MATKLKQVLDKIIDKINTVTTNANDIASKASSLKTEASDVVSQYESNKGKVYAKSFSISSSSWVKSNDTYYYDCKWDSAQASTYPLPKAQTSTTDDSTVVFAFPGIMRTQAQFEDFMSAHITIGNGTSHDIPSDGLIRLYAINKPTETIVIDFVYRM